VQGYNPAHQMLLVFLLFGLASLAVLGVLLFSIILGAGLCFTARFRTLGIFVLLVPTLSALSAATASWGAMLLCDWLSQGASVEAWERWQVLAFWAWPIGFGFGGIAGMVLGLLIAVLINRRRARNARLKVSPVALTQT
jgi:hypothetical protein